MFQTAAQSRGVNDTRFQDLITKCHELGRDMGAGEQSRAALFCALVRGAADGYVMPYDRKQHSKDVLDDAAECYRAFSQSYSKRVKHDAQTSVTVQVSKFRNAVNVGLHPMGGAAIISELNRVQDAREQAITSVGIKEVKPHLDMLVDWARDQIKSETPLSDDQIKMLVMKPDPKAKEAMKVWAECLKKMDKLAQGIANADGTVTQDTDDRINTVRDIMKDRLAGYGVDTKRAELARLQAELAELDQAA